MLTSKLLDQIESSKSVLIAGAGGGFDIFSGLPIYFGLRNQGIDAHLASFSFTELSTLSGDFLTPTMVRVTADSREPTFYFPEMYLSQWFREQRKEEVPVYAFKMSGVKPLLKNYRLLKDMLDLDNVVLVDGGTDSLLSGDEEELGTPLEDMTSIAAVNQLDVPVKILASLGFGIDRFHGVCHAHVLEFIAGVIQDGGFLGALSLLNDMHEVELYRAATEFVNRKMPRKSSIVCSSILSALEGQFGDYHTNQRTAGSELFINPLMSVLWGFDLSTVAKRVNYLDKLTDTVTRENAILEIQKYRNELTKTRARKILPI